MEERWAEGDMVQSVVRWSPRLGCPRYALTLFVVRRRKSDDCLYFVKVMSCKAEPTAYATVERRPAGWPPHYADGVQSGLDCCWVQRPASLTLPLPEPEEPTGFAGLGWSAGGDADDDMPDIPPVHHSGP